VGATRQRLAEGAHAGGLSGPRWAARSCWAAVPVMGCGRSWAKKKRRRVEEKKRLSIFKTIQTNEFKQEFEFKHSKQCTSMYATVNSYISLFN
jgi:hypothetical protein